MVPGVIGASFRRAPPSLGAVAPEALRYTPAVRTAGWPAETSVLGHPQQPASCQGGAAGRSAAMMPGKDPA